MIIKRRHGIAGARGAVGPTIVIDVFRAFSAAAYALAAGAERIILTETVEEAAMLARSIPGCVLMGEVDGARPEGFDVGNSPGEIVSEPAKVAGRSVIHRSSAGTRCARAAHASGAKPLLVAGLVVASATARALRGSPAVTIVAAGLHGEATAEEDAICGDLIAELLAAGTADTQAAADRVAGLERARELRKAHFSHPADVALCTEVDRFDFAMSALDEEGRLTVTAVT